MSPHLVFEPSELQNDRFIEQLSMRGFANHNHRHVHPGFSSVMRLPVQLDNIFGSLRRRLSSVVLTNAPIFINLTHFLAKNLAPGRKPGRNRIKGLSRDVIKIAQRDLSSTAAKQHCLPDATKLLIPGAMVISSSYEILLRPWSGD